MYTLEYFRTNDDCDIKFLQTSTGPLDEVFPSLITDYLRRFPIFYDVSLFNKDNEILRIIKNRFIFFFY